MLPYNTSEISNTKVSYKFLYFFTSTISQSKEFFSFVESLYTPQLLTSSLS